MENYIAILLTITLNSLSCVIQENNVMQSQIMQSEPIETIARNLTDAGYSGLFLRGDHSLSDSIWQNGKNRLYLEQIVKSNHYSDLARILASLLDNSEIIFYEGSREATLGNSLRYRVKDAAALV